MKNKKGILKRKEREKKNLNLENERKDD